METKTHGQFDARYSYFSSISHLNSLKNNTPKFSSCRSSLRIPVSSSSPMNNNRAGHMLLKQKRVPFTTPMAGNNIGAVKAVRVSLRLWPPTEILSRGVHGSTVCRNTSPQTGVSQRPPECDGKITKREHLPFPKPRNTMKIIAYKPKIAFLLK